MISVLLAILKILGVILLVLSGIILTVILLVLFVPVRYRITARRRTEEEIPIAADIRVTWLAHVFNLAFSYPEAAYLRVRILCFTVFSPGGPKEDPDASNKDRKKKKRGGEKKEEKKEAHAKKQIPKEEIKREREPDEDTLPEEKEQAPGEDGQGKEESRREEEQEREKKRDGRKSRIVEFLEKLWSCLKNIKYTITAICDKIKHIVNNIQYYTEILKSDTFHRAWKVCGGQALLLLKMLRPRKVSGSLLIGTGDPAGTGQILALYGIFYPLAGNHIDIIPDFERQIIEGELFVKGRLTVFRFLRAAWIVYFNKDLRRLIKLFKREAA